MFKKIKDFLAGLEINNLTEDTAEELKHALLKEKSKYYMYHGVVILSFIIIGGSFYYKTIQDPFRGKLVSEGVATPLASYTYDDLNSTNTKYKELFVQKKNEVESVGRELYVLQTKTSSSTGYSTSPTIFLEEIKNDAEIASKGKEIIKQDQTFKNSVEMLFIAYLNKHKDLSLELGSSGKSYTVAEIAEKLKTIPNDTKDQAIKEVVEKLFETQKLSFSAEYKDEMAQAFLKLPRYPMLASSLNDIDALMSENALLDHLYTEGMLKQRSSVNLAGFSAKVPPLPKEIFENWKEAKAKEAQSTKDQKLSELDEVNRKYKQLTKERDALNFVIELTDRKFLIQNITHYDQIANGVEKLVKLIEDTKMPFDKKWEEIGFAYADAKPSKATATTKGGK